MPEITASIPFEVYCGECGAGLCGNMDERQKHYNGQEARFDIEPCEKCMKEAEERGYEEGYEMRKQEED